MNGTTPGGSAGGRLLPCGRAEQSVLEAATEPGTILDAHQQRCPYCSAAVAAMRRRWSAVIAEAAAPVPVPAGLVERMVGRVRTALAEPGYLEVPSARGRLRIARSVVEDIARQVVRDHGLRVCGLPGPADGGRVDDRGATWCCPTGRPPPGRRSAPGRP